MGREGGDVGCQRVTPGSLVVELFCVLTVVVVMHICTQDNIAEKKIYTGKQAWIQIKLVNSAGPWFVSMSVSWCDGAL